MSISVLWRAVRGRWYTLVQELWPDSPEELTRAEIARLTDDLARRHGGLIRLRRRIEQARDRQQRLLADPSLAADRLQRSVERLIRLEAVYEKKCRQLRRRKRLREALVRGQMQVVEVVHATGGAETF
jgi:hypothetical protein